MVKLFATSFLLFLASLFPALLHAQSPRIMCLGNSITQADNNHVGYRFRLWQKLIDEGISTEFVGSHQVNHGGPSPNQNMEYKGQVFTNRNEGHWGWRADEILNGQDGTQPSDNKLENWLNGYTPDIALIHLGTNDVFQGQTIESTIEDITAVIEKIRAKNATVSIYLAQVIPANLAHDDIQNRLKQLNSEIAKLAASLNSPASPVTLVDQHTGFDAAIHTYDNVHPNEQGEELMAQRWFEAITPRITPLPVTLVNFNARYTPEGNVTINWETASETNNLYFEVQRSSADSIHFTPIGRVNGNGTTNTPITYTFLDELPPSGNLYYRLKQVDLDGTETLSKLIHIHRPKERVALHIYPTVVRDDHVTVNFQVQEPHALVALTIYAANGTVVQTISGRSDTSGSFREMIPVETLEGNGLYIIRAVTKGYETQRKFIADQ